MSFWAWKIFHRYLKINLTTCPCLDQIPDGTSGRQANLLECLTSQDNINLENSKRLPSWCVGIAQVRKIQKHGALSKMLNPVHVIHHINTWASSPPLCSPLVPPSASGPACERSAGSICWLLFFGLLLDSTSQPSQLGGTRQMYMHF